jgi:hypothetical protein
MKQAFAALAAALLLAGAPASATLLGSDPLPDRSGLSYEENVVINTACAALRSAGSDAYYGCVRKQLAALQGHPTPDRTGLSGVRNAAVEKACTYEKRVGIAAYNDCLKKAIENKDTEIAEERDDDPRPNMAKFFVETAASAPASAPTPEAKLPTPETVLAQRPASIERAALSAAEIYKKVGDAVFVVLASRSLSDARARNIAQGSAVAVSDRLLLTNCHVVQDRPVIKIVQDRTSDDATLVAADPQTDRCVIQAATLKLTPVGGVVAFDKIAIGERVFAIGTPISFERTLSEGLVSGLRRQKNRHLVQTSAPITHGSSGGGLFDERGNLIGITALGFGAGEVNFAIAAADYWK